MNEDMQSVSYDPPAGESIDRACVIAVDMARKHDAPIVFTFNGVEMTAYKNSRPRDLMVEWEAKLDKQAEDYRNSPEGIAENARREEEVKIKQKRISELLGNIGPLLDSMTEEEILKAFLTRLNEALVENSEENSPDALMDWLYAFAEIADDCRVYFNTQELAAKLESSGFIESEYVGNKPEWFNTKDRMARYIIGQTLNCLKMGMPPHPITMSFIEQYRELPKG